MSELWKLGSFLRHSSTRKGQIMPLKISHADKHAKMKKKITSEIFDLWNFYPEIFTIHIERFSKIMALLKSQFSPSYSRIWSTKTKVDMKLPKVALCQKKEDGMILVNIDSCRGLCYAATVWQNLFWKITERNTRST